MTDGQPRLFDIGTIPEEPNLEDQRAYEVEYLRQIQPVIEGLGAQLGHVDEDGGGLFRITPKTGCFYMEPKWDNNSQSSSGLVVVTTHEPHGDNDWSRSTFTNVKKPHTSETFEGFLMAVGRDTYTQRVYGVFYYDCTDTESSMVCIDLQDIGQIGRYTENASRILAIYQNAAVDGAAYGRSSPTGTQQVRLSFEYMQHIIDRYWPEPEVVYQAPGTTQ